MEAKELRIGNWCEIIKSPYGSENGVHQIEAITIHYFECGEDLILEPIPLTEKWLLKFGFRMSKVLGVYSNSFVKTDILKSELYFRPSYQGGYFWGFNTEVNKECEFYNAKEVMYVHQLQNLYFALTGEELTIK